MVLQTSCKFKDAIGTVNVPKLISKCISLRIVTTNHKLYFFQHIPLTGECQYIIYCACNVCYMCACLIPYIFLSVGENY